MKDITKKKDANGLFELLNPLLKFCAIRASEEGIIEVKEVKKNAIRIQNS